MTPRFSVVIPTHNRARDIAGAVASVLAQSCQDFEILVMDDGSTDETAAVIASFHDARIRYEWESQWGGPARPRNRGIAKAQGEWVCFLDADDSWMDDKLTACLAHADAAVDLMYHDMSMVGAHVAGFTRRRLRSRALRRPALVDLLVNGNPIVNSSVVVRRRVLESVGGVCEDKAMIASEDYNTWLRVAQRTEGLRYIPEVLGFYAVHADGISQRDMSMPTREAVAPFLGVLGATQRLTLEAGLRYSQGRYMQRTRGGASAVEDMKFVLRHGRAALRVKAGLLLAGFAAGATLDAVRWRPR